MGELPEDALFDGLAVDLVVRGTGPEFGDLFTICGYENPNFPPPGAFEFSSLADLQFSQVDDYFGVSQESEDGDDVSVWLYPLINGEVVHHQPGPFDGIRVTYCVLRNPTSRMQLFLTVVRRLAELLDAELIYRTRGTQYTLPSLLEQLAKDAVEITRHWEQQGIVPGTDEALEQDI